MVVAVEPLEWLVLGLHLTLLQIYPQPLLMMGVVVVAVVVVTWSQLRFVVLLVLLIVLQA